MSPNINNLSPSQIKKLERIAKLLDGGNLAVGEHLFELEDELQTKLEQIEAKIPDINKFIENLKGTKGDKGEKGDRGDKGDKGDSGKDGRDGRDGRDGKDGKDGEMGMVDEATIAYLEDEIQQLKQELGSIGKTVKNSRYMRDGIGQVVRQLVAGSNVTINNANPEYPIITATGGSGSTTVETPTGTVNASNTSFTVSAEPKFIVSDGVTYFASAGYTYAALTVTMDVAPSQYIRAII